MTVRRLLWVGANEYAPQLVPLYVSTGKKHMKVVLTRKLADCIDGVDVAHYRVGDVMELAPKNAHLLIAERWATPDRRTQQGSAPEEERRRPVDPSPPPSKHDAIRRAS